MKLCWICVTFASITLAMVGMLLACLITGISIVWFWIGAAFATVILGVVGIWLACVGIGQENTASIQKRVANSELARVRAKNELVAPVQDMKIVESTLTLGGDREQAELDAIIDDYVIVLLPEKRSTPEDLADRRRQREALRKKYNL